MEKIIVAHCDRCAYGLDDNYTLFDDGTVVHKYDTHHIGGKGYDKISVLRAAELNIDVKNRLLKVTREKDIELVKQLLQI